MQGAYELLFYPTYHLDASSLLLRHPLHGPPVALDTQDNHVLEVTSAFEIVLYGAVISGELSPLSQPKLQLQRLRSLTLPRSIPRPVAMVRMPVCARTQKNDSDRDHMRVKLVSVAAVAVAVPAHQSSPPMYVSKQ